MKNDLFKDLKKEILEIKDRNTHLADDSAFVAWFLRAFISEDEKQAVDSLTGQAGDKSSDAIFIDHDNRIVFIVQGKYHSNNQVSEPRSHIIALSTLGRSIAADKPESFKALLNKANATAQKSFEESRKLIKERDYQLVMRYVSTGKISDTHLKEAQANIDDFDNIRFETYAYSDLMKLMQDYIEGAAPPIPTISLPVQGTEVFSRSDKEKKITSWIFTMGGTEVGNIFNDKGVRLFARNIRGYLGNTDINRVMKSTIEEEPEYFWYYNNGITIVCDKAEQRKDGGSNVIKVRNAQIINGQQTTRTLALCGKNYAEVLVKLIEIPRDDESNKHQYRHLISEIVSATNWQNAISQSDLKSNDTEQVRIEREFKKLNYFYIRKRMTKREAVSYGANKYSYKISKEELARAIAACDADPYEVRLGKDRLFEDDLYSKLFNERKAAEYITIYWLYRYVLYQSRGNEKTVHAKWHVLNLIWLLIKHDLKKNLYRDQLRKMVEREKKYSKELQPLKKLIRVVFDLSLAFYRKNKKIDGKVQDARDFYKHVNYHKKFFDFYKHSAKSRQKINLQLNMLLKNIATTKDN
ncbi:MAG: AIPR family protein [Ignavibacteriaceae bacterium]